MTIKKTHKVVYISKTKRQNNIRNSTSQQNQWDPKQLQIRESKIEIKTQILFGIPLETFALIHTMKNYQTKKIKIYIKFSECICNNCPMNLFPIKKNKISS